MTSQYHPSSFLIKKVKSLKGAWFPIILYSISREFSSQGPKNLDNIWTLFPCEEPEETNILLPSNFGLFILRSCEALLTSTSITTTIESVSCPALSFEQGPVKLYGWLTFSSYVSESFLKPPKRECGGLDLMTVPILYDDAHGHSLACTHFVFLFWKVFLKLLREESRYCLHRHMDKIKVPTQVIWGKQDQVRSACLGPPVPVTPACEEMQAAI